MGNSPTRLLGGKKKDHFTTKGGWWCGENGNLCPNKLQHYKIFGGSTTSGQLPSHGSEGFLYEMYALVFLRGIIAVVGWCESSNGKGTSSPGG